MYIIVGLGNPGAQYEKTRHNIGFMIVDALATTYNCSWKLNKRAKALIMKEKINNCNVEVIKPQTFMNLSGISVKTLLSDVRCQMSDVIVVHDDVDLEFGTIRVSFNSSSGGHKGVESIIDHLHSKEFWRIRIGIKSVARSKEMGASKKINTPDFVLRNFSKEEQINLPKIINKSIELLDSYLSNPLTVQTIHLP